MTKLVSNEAFEKVRDNKYRATLDTRSKVGGDSVRTMIIRDIGLFRDHVELRGWPDEEPIRMRMHTWEALVTRVEQHPYDLSYWWAEWSGDSKDVRHQLKLSENPWDED